MEDNSPRMEPDIESEFSRLFSQGLSYSPQVLSEGEVFLMCWTM